MPEIPSIEEELRGCEGSLVEVWLADGSIRHGDLIRVDVHGVAEFEDADADEFFIPCVEIDRVEIVDA
jgi:hypothetical protein